MSDPKQQLEHLMYKIQDMRQRQVQYFKSRDNTNLNLSKKAEKEVDALVMQLEREGYKPTPKPTAPVAQQTNFFDAEDGLF